MTDMKNLTLTKSYWQSSATRNTYQVVFNGNVTIQGASYKQIAFKASKLLKLSYKAILEAIEAVTTTTWAKSKDWYILNQQREDYQLARWEESRQRNA